MSNSTKKITESEYEIMKVLWAQDRPMSFAEIREEVQKDSQWGQSTIKTLLGRLTTKGVIRQKKRDVYYYTPVVTQQMYNDAQTENLIEKLYNGRAGELVAALLDKNQLDKAELDRLRALLRDEGEGNE